MFLTIVIIVSVYICAGLVWAYRHKGIVSLARQREVSKWAIPMLVIVLVFYGIFKWPAEAVDHFRRAREGKAKYKEISEMATEVLHLLDSAKKKVEEGDPTRGEEELKSIMADLSKATELHLRVNLESDRLKKQLQTKLSEKEQLLENSIATLKKGFGGHRQE